ncbi:MAG TPA: hypothetical protein PKC35_18995, partial [Leptospiraceae bacterium]|nr:hypothetical protein [Leptospiraceae bacterium]
VIATGFKRNAAQGAPRKNSIFPESKKPEEPPVRRPYFPAATAAPLKKAVPDEHLAEVQAEPEAEEIPFSIGGKIDLNNMSVPAYLRKQQR